MSSGREPLSGLRIGDVLTFLTVYRHGSLAGAARTLKVTSSQVSKAVARLEAILRTRLIVRSGRGIILSDDGQRIAPELADLLGRLRRLRVGDVGDDVEVTIAAPSYLSELILPVLATCQPDRVRGIDLPPAHVRAYAADNVFDLAVTAGEERLQGGWLSAHIGSARRALFASPALAAKLLRRGRALSIDQLAEVPFITPIYFSSGQFVPGDDDCPLAWSQRRLGHKVQTLKLGLELAARTDQLIFGPAIAARGHVRDHSLVELRVDEWDVRDELYLLANEARVRARSYRSILSALRELLEDKDT